jgi:hypothetical protein
VPAQDSDHRDQHPQVVVASNLWPAATTAIAQTYAGAFGSGDTTRLTRHLPGDGDGDGDVPIIR